MALESGMGQRTINQAPDFIELVSWGKNTTNKNTYFPYITL